MSALKKLGTALALIPVAVIALVLIAAVALPAVLGWIPLTVRSGSMEPTYPVGSQVVVKPLEGEARKQLRSGDIITFMPNPDDPTLVTHRVVGVQAQSDGSVSYTTRGDANGADDPDAVYDYQVRAKAVYHVPLMGYVAGWIDPQIRQYLIYSLVALLFAYAGYQVFKAVNERKGRGVRDAAVPHSAGPHAAGSAPDTASPEGLSGGEAAGSREAAGASAREVSDA